MNTITGRSRHAVAPRHGATRRVKLLAVTVVLAVAGLANGGVVPVVFAACNSEATCSTVTASPNQVPANNTTTSTITVSLKNNLGVPIVGNTVTLAKIAGVGSPTISPASGPSNVLGVVTFTVKSATNGTDTFQATDTTSGTVIAQTAEVTFGPVSDTHSTVTASPNQVPADGATASTITVTLKDQNGVGVAGKSVTLAAISGSPTPSISGPATTNGSGVATFFVTCTAPGTSTFQATDTTDSLVVVQTAQVTFGPVSQTQSTVTASPGSVTADGSTVSTITVTLRDQSGNPVSGKTVSLAKTAGPGSPTISAASGPSDGGGVVTFTVKSTTVGTDTFQATDTADTVTIDQTADVNFTTGPVSAADSTVTASPTNVPADGTTISTITVTLLDSQGHRISGRTVSVSKTSGPGAPVISPPSAVSDANGVATFTVKSTTVGTDVFTATDSSDAITITQTASVTFDTGAVDAAHSTVTASPNQVAADNTATSTITVTLKDSLDHAVPGKTVTLAQVAGVGAPTISAASGPSDANGVVTFTVKSATTGTDTFQATDTSDAVTITQTAEVTFGPVSDTHSTLSATPGTVPADGATPSTVTVTLKDANGAGVASKTVSLAKTAGPGTPNISAPCVTNGSGQCTFSVTSFNAGTDTFTATDTTDNLVVTQTANVTFTAGGVNAAHSDVSASPTSVPADGSTTSTITVTLKDVHDNPVSGKTVTLSKTAGPGSPTISAASGPSDSNGQVTFTVKSTTLGNDTFQATDTTDSVIVTDTADVTFTAGPADAGMSTVSASPTSVVADGTTTSTITVTLKDANGNLVSGKTVTLAKSAGPGTPTISSASGPSDVNGVVTFTVKSTTAGIDTFQATDTTDSVTITQTANVTFTAGAVNAANSTVSASPTSVPADGTTTSTITVTLKDANSNPVSGKAVTLAKTSGPGSPTITGPSPTLTDANGQVTFLVRSSTPGMDTFQATDTTDSVVVTQTAQVTFTVFSPPLPNSAGSRSTQQYQLPNSDGATWQEIDQALRVVRAPAQARAVLLTANADLWTATAGYNQDLGIFVSDNGGGDSLLAWKESGGFAGTFSPNAAYAQVLYNMAAGHTYTFKLKWKTNKPASGAVIYAGAGPISGQYSPTSLIAKVYQPGAAPVFRSRTQQFSLSDSNGTTWQTIDGTNLATTVSPAFTSVAVVGGNADLWTSSTGVNQDLAILVKVDGGADQLLAWKESGGFGGTFSPNAAFVKARLPMTAGHSYAFRLAWKSNNNTSGTGKTIFAGAGPISGQYSPTSLLVETQAASEAAASALSNSQYQLTGSNGSTWQLMDPALNVTLSPADSGQAILGANADLWTTVSGYNQDIAIFVSDNSGADQLLAWKESGGSAGTFSPNAAYVQDLFTVTAGHTYVFKLKWKTNRNAPGVTIVAGAGSAPFSPTRLIAETTL